MKKIIIAAAIALISSTAAVSAADYHLGNNFFTGGYTLSDGRGNAVADYTYNPFKGGYDIETR
tara:strand:+ start:174 stop:362 length:189 start_codon:yes stop_codon:yes gene_type:complete